ncbi:MAG: hypothetical protein ACRDNB_11335 [Gaiellaceae bacterium]
MAPPETPADSPLTLEQAMSSPFYGNLMAPELRPGETAVDFELPLLDPETHHPSGRRVRLGDFAGERPVALVFGSYT